MCQTSHRGHQEIGRTSLHTSSGMTHLADALPNEPSQHLASEHSVRSCQIRHLHLPAPSAGSWQLWHAAEAWFGHDSSLSQCLSAREELPLGSAWWLRRSWLLWMSAYAGCPTQQHPHSEHILYPSPHHSRLPAAWPQIVGCTWAALE